MGGLLFFSIYAEKLVTRNTIVATIGRLVERIVRVKELILKGLIDDEDFSMIGESDKIDPLLPIQIDPCVPEKIDPCVLI